MKHLKNLRQVGILSPSGTLRVGEAPLKEVRFTEPALERSEGLRSE